MTEYKKLLQDMTVLELKELIRTYLKHVKIPLSKIKKAEAIEHLLKHTEYKNNQIILKEGNINFNLINEGFQTHKQVREEHTKYKKERKQVVKSENENLISKVKYYFDIDKWKELKKDEKKMIYDLIDYIKRNKINDTFIESLPKHLKKSP